MSRESPMGRDEAIAAIVAHVRDEAIDYEGRRLFPAELAEIVGDAVDWANHASWYEEDRRALAHILLAGKFKSWMCPTCPHTILPREEAVYWAETPEGYELAFPDAKQTNYALCPGYGIGTDDRRCDTCRILDESGFSEADESAYIPDGYELKLVKKGET